MHKKLMAAKVDAILNPDLAFFGSLICNLKFVEDSTCDTAWTDGTRLGYNPLYIDGLSHAETMGLLAHEVLHCADGHPWRRDGREAYQWNVACDLAINWIISEAGLTLPKGGLVADSTQQGKSAEWIYDRLPSQPQPQDGQGQGQGKPQDGQGKPQDGQGQGQGQGQGKPIPGEVRDAPSGQDDSQDGQEQDAPMSEAEWREQVRVAAVEAKMRGKLPAGLDRYAKHAVESRVDWKAALRKFIQQNAKADYTWSWPSSRYASQGLYLPGLHSEDMPRIAIGIDTSGSIDDIALAKAKAEILAVMEECSPAGIDVFYCDAAVARHDSFERGDIVEFRPAGGGGTDFRPVFDAVAKLDEQPCCIVYVTDLYGSFPESSDLPTLWVTDTSTVVPPFGEVIHIG